MVVEHEDLRELTLRPHRVHLELAEVPADPDMLLGRQMLVAYDDDLVLDQGGFERLERRRLVLLLEVERVDLRAEPCAQALNLERRLAGGGGRFVAGDVDVHGLLRIVAFGMIAFAADYAASKRVFQAGCAGQVALTGGAAAR